MYSNGKTVPSPLIDFIIKNYYRLIDNIYNNIDNNI